MSCPASTDSPAAVIAQVMHYGSYLQLGKLLSSQRPESWDKDERKAPVHDEHLFIVFHQVFELWFKQVIVEIVSVRHILQTNENVESSMATITTRLKRVVMIMKLFNEQFPILETMTPMSFLDFRGWLAPASGFQSLQFRIIEELWGVQKELRFKIVRDGRGYRDEFDSDAGQLLQEAEEATSLRETVEAWLERTPGLDEEDARGFNFPKRYTEAVRDMLRKKHEKNADPSNPGKAQFDKTSYEKDLELFDILLDADKYKKSKEAGNQRFSRKATFGALMIFLYRDEPRFSPAFDVLQLLMDIDTCLINWRHIHAGVVQRYLGGRVGTAGTSAYGYLKSTVSNRYKVFLDLFNLASYILPREHVPELTPEIKVLLARQLDTSSTDTAREPPSYADDTTLGQYTKKLLFCPPQVMLNLGEAKPSKTKQTEPTEAKPKSNMESSL